MAESRSATDVRGSRITDARGRTVRLLDPVRLYLLSIHSIIPAAALESMSGELLPGARRQKKFQFITMGLSLLFVGGGTVAYFKYFSTWKGFDPVNVTIYALQLILIVAGPVLAIHFARKKYYGRVATVMLQHRYCPHCGYDLRSQRDDTVDHVVVCPECGCATESLGKGECKMDP
ncbi:MAG: hypothetical protein ACYTHJ_19760 [Planctomycetota bacterium]|jgi:hypothetical protein